MKSQESARVEIIDTHCHIHDPEFFDTDKRDEAFTGALATGVNKMLLIGTSLSDSEQAVDFAHLHPTNLRVAVGIHPHEAAKMSDAQIDDALDGLRQLAKSDLVSAIGECGFDFFYNDRDKFLERQIRLLTGQLEIARDLGLPLSFHVRDAFDDFWPVLAKFGGIRGVLHSYTDSQSNLKKALGLGLMMGVNGIATFTKDKSQIEMFKSIPLEEILLETDSPFLTPTPFRGTINTPKNVEVVARFIAESRGITYENVAKQTSINARRLFSGL